MKYHVRYWKTQNCKPFVSGWSYLSNIKAYSFDTNYDICPKNAVKSFSLQEAITLANLFKINNRHYSVGIEVYE